MATLQTRNDSYRILFCHDGKRYAFTIGKVTADEAASKSEQVDYLLMRLKQGYVSIPPGVAITDFVAHDGNVPEAVAAAPAQIGFADFKKRYLDTYRDGGMEANSLQTVALHLGHFEATLGGRFVLQKLTLGDLQRHVNRRREKKYRGKKLSPVTLKKEMASFRAGWNWAAQMEMVKGPFPSRGVVYPKADEKPPFMPWPEVERRIAAATSDGAQAELWDCLYLTKPEIAELLAYVKEYAAHDWIYPAFCFVAHTGARRSEILRVLVSDVDFEAETVLLREKKRSRKQRTTRRVPLTPVLAAALREWLKDHPGGPALFCHQDEVFRSKKRSRTTGHLNDQVRPKSQKARQAFVKPRADRPGPGVLTKDELHDHFKRTLADSKWNVVPGWHCFRHSFISLCASMGVDQRLIDEWVGHQTEEQRKRYRHLLLSIQRQVIRSVFGDEA